METIECIGPPGSGKSTILPLIKEISSDYNKDILLINEAMRKAMLKALPWASPLIIIPGPLSRELARRMFRRTKWYLYQKRFMLHHLDLVHEVIMEQKKRIIPSDHKEMLIDWFIESGGTYEFLNDYLPEGEKVLFGEGFAHRSVNLFVSEQENVDQNLLEKYLDRIPKMKLIIKVNTDKETCVNRLKKRGLTHRLRDKNDEEIRKFVVNSQEAINCVTQFLTRRNVSFIEVDNGGSLRETTTHLKQKIREFYDR